VSAFFAQKRPVQKESEYPGTILHYACQLGCKEVIKELLKDPLMVGSINDFDDVSYTPLMHAVRHGDVSLVDLLVAAGADVNIRDESHIGNTVLRESIETAHPDMVKKLLDLGANPNIEGWMQLTAIDKAIERYEKNPSTDSGIILKLLESARKS
jgi:ankyrin repeat protein